MRSSMLSFVFRPLLLLAIASFGGGLSSAAFVNNNYYGGHDGDNYDDDDDGKSSPPPLGSSSKIPSAKHLLASTAVPSSYWSVVRASPQGEGGYNQQQQTARKLPEEEPTSSTKAGKQERTEVDDKEVQLKNKAAWSSLILVHEPKKNLSTKPSSKPSTTTSSPEPTISNLLGKDEQKGGENSMNTIAKVNASLKPSSEQAEASAVQEDHSNPKKKHTKDPSTTALLSLPLEEDGSCPIGKSPLKLNLRTDYYPTETTWDVKDVDLDTIIHSSDPYDSRYTLHEETMCMDVEKCYQFAIYDTRNNGICCDDDYYYYYDDGFSTHGYFQLFYESSLILEGGDFNFEMKSIWFGNGCPSSTPTASFVPSTSFEPTIKPSISLFPSDEPSEKLTSKPVSNPSSTPSISLAPTSIRAVRKGTFSIAVIRVTGADGISPSKTAAEISDDVFGTNGDPLNPVIGFKECSGDQTIIIPAEGEGFEGGVMDLILTEDIEDVEWGKVGSYVTAQLIANGINISDYKRVFYILPSAIDFPYPVDYRVGISYLRDDFSSIHFALMQSIGYGFNHQFSGSALDGTDWNDTTCMMGIAPRQDDAPRMCFNGAKSWWFGWYSKRHMTIHPTLNSFCGKMISVHDYLNGEANAGDQFTVLRILATNEIDLYVMFNRAEGANAEVEGSRNQVTVVAQDGDFEQSYFQAGLAEGLEWVKDNWNGSGKRLVVRVCSIMYGSPDYALVLVYVEGINDLDCGSIEPSSSPSVSSFPSDEPSVSSKPLSRPSSKPSTEPSVSPKPSSRPSEFTCANESEASVRVEIYTDYYPSQTKWTVIDVLTNHVMLNGGPYDAYNYYFNDETCISKNSCYNFHIVDTYNNGMCCSDGNGYYKVYFDDFLIQEGGEFEYEEYSEPFGEGCSQLPSTGPSLSSKPSKSPKPSLSPSPSTHFPSESPSTKPSISLQPSFSPTRTSLPTSSPTKLSELEFARDSLDRRRFPPLLIRPADGSVPYPSLPDCNFPENKNRIGCINFPKPHKMSKVEWAGKLFQSVPKCTTNKNGRNSQCKSNVPVSKKLVPTHLIPSSSGFQEKNIMMLPGDIDKPGRSVASGDFDNDGHVDIFIGYFRTPGQILYGKGHGKFHYPVDIPGGNLTTHAAYVADLDGDGLTDIVTISFFGFNEPSFIFWNDGTGRGNFTPMELPGNPENLARCVDFGDFNGDGHLDLVVGQYLFSNQLLINNGDKSFTVTSLPRVLGIGDTRDVAVGDINNDGNIDIVVGNYRAPNVLLLGRGNGTFDLSTNDEFSWTTDVSIADINGDGFVDILVGNLLDTEIIWNHGNGTFTTSPLPPVRDYTGSIHIADVDGDGEVNIVIRSSGYVHLILRYIGNNEFDVMELPYVYMGNSAIADVDGNGLLDIIYITSTGTPNQVLMNYIDGRPDSLRGKSFIDIDFPDTPKDTEAILTLPLNGADTLDVVLANFRQPNQVLLMSGDGSIAKTISLPDDNLSDQPKLTSTCIVPMRNKESNRTDLFVCNHASDYNQILANMGDGEFSSIEVPGSLFIQTLSAASGDLNNDGLTDLVIGNKDNVNQVLLNNGDNTFREINIAGTGSSQTTCIALADLSGDNFLDIIVGNGDDDAQANYILTNKGDGTQFESVELPGGNSITRSIAIGNLHNNHTLDIVVGNHQGTNYVLYNNGSAFEAKELPGGALFTNALALGDMDDDGDLDIVISNGYSSSPEPNQILFNEGGGEFTEYIIPKSDAHSTSVSISDFNGDGRLDMIFGNYGRANTVFLQSVCESDGAQLHSQSWCYRCPGFMARDNTHFGRHTAKCRECKPDHIRSDFSETCSLNPCLNGERPHGTDECVQCKKGTFYNTSVVREEDDPESWARKRCVACDKGTFSDWSIPAIDQCSLCPPGSIQNTTGASDCERCPIGTYSAASGAESSVACLSCLPGTFSNETSQTECQRCPKGTYQPTSGSTECIPCPSGSFTDVKGQSKCSECPIGSSQSSTGASDCLSCIPGTFQSLQGQATCDPCEAGSYCDHTETTCTMPCPCHPGTYNEQEGGKQKSDCIPCREGTYSTTTGADDSAECLECLPGFYSNVTGQTECIRCPVGSHQPNGGSMECIPCASGTYIDTEGQTRCIECSIGSSQSNTGSSKCASCIPGTFQSLRGQATCDPCEAGSYCDPFETTCTMPCPCHPGTYNDQEGRTQKSDCIPCRKGTYSTTTGANSSSTCIECLPGTFSNETGQTECIRCPMGSHQPNSGSTECIPCESGTYIDTEGQTRCIECSIGSSQSNTGSSNCTSCNPGTFQSLRGEASCNLCEAGSYCDPTETTCAMPCPCQPGTYNDQEGKSNKSDCIPCREGTYSTLTGADNSAACLECLPGSYSSHTGQTECTQCPAGSHQSDSGGIKCIQCESGTYADTEGQSKCSQCPYRLSSTNNSTTCGLCAEGFYLKDLTVSVFDIFSRPSENCFDCPDKGNCPFNTTLETLIIPPNHWRESTDTSTIYKCDNKACSGSSSQRMTVSNSYCITGHSGPLCQVCTSGSEYFSSNGICEDCPSLSRLFIPTGIIIGLLAVLFISRFFANRFQRYRSFLQNASNKIFAMGLQAKVKLFISFYQIIKRLEDVYGVEVDKDVKSWLNFLQIFQFGLSQILAIPSACIGSMKQRLLLGGMWPFMAISLCFVSIACHALFILKRRSTDYDDLKRSVWMRLLYISIIILFLTLPSIAVAIFEAKKCQPFDANDTTKETASYLISDWSIRCDQGGSIYEQLQTIFWVLFSIWLVAIPVSAFGLLMKIKHSVQSQQVTPLAEACSFLWRDYKKEYMYWEIISLTHKLFLTGIIMFVDTQEGSEKILRLMMAILVSTAYLSILLNASPYQRREDHNLALISNILLISCFVLGVPLQLCHDGVGTCQDFIGLHLDSYNISVLAVILIISMMAVTFMFIVIVGFKNDADATIIKLERTNERPVLDLPSDCKFHVFVSHVWSSGQDKTHSLVERLRKYIPGIKVWLDVESLTNMESLESSVGESAIIIILYTEGYFQSRNCRREVYAAVKAGKPTIVLYEGEDSTVEKMKESCLEHCTEEDGLSSDDILRHLLSEDPMLWLGASSRYFAIASIKELSLRILKNLPYYQRNAQELSRGLRVGGELGEVNLQKECTLFFSSQNSNAERIARELQEMVANTMSRQSGRSSISITRSSRKNNCITTVEDIESYSSEDLHVNFDQEAFFILYLDDKVFADPDGILVKQVKNAIQSGLEIILVHETDIQMGGVPFDRFFEQTPRELIISPYKLFGDIAITLYTFEDYRKVSLRLMLCKIRDASISSMGKSWLGRSINRLRR